MNQARFSLYWSCGIVLAAALERFLVAVGGAQVLALPDPLIGIPVRYAVLLVGGLELATAIICLSGKHPELRWAWLAWPVANYFVFRLGLLALHCPPQGSCIGRFTDPLHLSQGIPGVATGLLPCVLLISICGAPIGLWREKRRTAAANFMKISCPACGVHIQFDLRNIGQRTSCPHCRQAITLRGEQNLKMPCFFCRGHIEFPACAVGTKMSCPHCNMGITLMEVV